MSTQINRRGPRWSRGGHFWNNQLWITFIPRTTAHPSQSPNQNNCNFSAHNEYPTINQVASYKRYRIMLLIIEKDTLKVEFV
jgi:hypothetical protein